MKYLNCAHHTENQEGPETLVTLIDVSPSMEETDWAPSRKAGAVEANKELIRIKHQHYPEDRMAIIAFGGLAKILHAPVCVRDAHKSLCRALNRPKGIDSTNFEAALTLAERCLFGNSAPTARNPLARMISDLLCEPYLQARKSSRKSAGPKRIIMLTDGEHNCADSPLPIAKRLKAAGVIIDCIGIGGSPEDVDEAILKKIASRNPDRSPRYCFIGDQGKLIQKYETLAHHIRVL